jgi:hypothetical protein
MNPWKRTRRHKIFQLSHTLESVNLERNILEGFSPHQPMLINGRTIAPEDNQPIRIAISSLSSS